MAGLAAQLKEAKAAQLDPNRGYEARIHLDANANAVPTPAVTDAILDALNRGGNPSSAHAGGEEGRLILTSARDAVAELCEGLFAENVIFTSGCTEANNAVVASAQAAKATLVTTAVEHPSILRPAEAFQASGGRLEVLQVDSRGLVDLDGLEAALRTSKGTDIRLNTDRKQ